MEIDIIPSTLKEDLRGLAELKRIGVIPKRNKVVFYCEGYARRGETKVVIKHDTLEQLTGTYDPTNPRKIAEGILRYMIIESESPWYPWLSQEKLTKGKKILPTDLEMYFCQKLRHIADPLNCLDPDDEWRKISGKRSEEENCAIHAAFERSRLLVLTENGNGKTVNTYLLEQKPQTELVETITPDGKRWEFR